MRLELVFEGLDKNYADKAALVDFSLRIGVGVHAILGPNGAGKSTLMNILSGNLSHSAGDILFNGKSIFALAATFRQKIAYMPQSCRIYEDFTAIQFMQYMAALKGLRPKSAKKEIEHYLAQVELSEDAGRKAGSFSGGMQRRLLLAATLLGNPQILLLDEPSAGLDPKQRIHLRKLIARESVDKITLLATHVVSDIENIAEDILLLKNGQVLRHDSAAALMQSCAGRICEKDFPKLSEGQMDDERVSHIKSLPDGSIRLRFVLPEGETIEEGARDVLPSLEDVYLCYFGKE